MKLKKFISGFCIISLLLSLNAVLVFAEEGLPDLSEKGKNSMQSVWLSDEELAAETIEEMEANVLERSYTGESYTLNNGETAYVVNEATASNTDPNNAYLVTNDTVNQGLIEAEGEMRWYGFPLEGKTKVTIVLQLVEDLDADLFMFKLNEETYTLEMIGGSATEGKGVLEYYNDIMDAGVYYFAVGGYEGTGGFAFGFYQSTADVGYEINDAQSLATTVELDKDIVGVIDNPYDIDYYTFTVTSSTVIKRSIKSSKGYSLLYAGNAGDGASIKPMGTEDLYIFMPGTYYFGVRSENNVYSSTDTYTIKFDKVGKIRDDSSLTKLWISVDADIIYQSDTSGTLNYVNGNWINYGYSYHNEITNSVGTQYYDITIDDTADAYVLDIEHYNPGAMHYISSTWPAMQVSGRPVLVLDYYSATTNFYKIHCRGTGAYSGNTHWEDFQTVRVLIDPETGNLVDILEPNYFYHYAPEGNNRIYVTSSYGWDYYGGN